MPSANGPSTKEPNYTELVIVCCHAVFIGGTGPEADPHNENQWMLQDFQRSSADSSKAGEHETFIKHIQAAIDALRRPNTIAIFSGGATTAAPLSEARSYMHVADVLYPSAQNRWRDSSTSFSRLSTEELATDSYQNLLFSILRFMSLTGRPPRFITVVTHAFKARRFLLLHANAIRWPVGRIRVEGINPPLTLGELDDVEAGERTRAYDLFVQDPYGTDAVLGRKRRSRNWSESALEEVKDGVQDESVRLLLQWTGRDGGTEIFPRLLPWEQSVA